MWNEIINFLLKNIYSLARQGHKPEEKLKKNQIEATAQKHQNFIEFL